MSDGGYFLSVLVFIAQADGILAEIIGVQQPIRDRADEVRRRYGTDQDLLDLLYPLLQLKNSPFAMSAKAREEFSTGDWLNRHQVLHGERSDYGTEMNSLKAFSFLVFVGLHIPAVLPKSANSAFMPES